MSNVQFLGLCHKAPESYFYLLRLSAAASDNEIGQTLCRQLDAQKAAGRPVRLVLDRVRAACPLGTAVRDQASRREGIAY